MVHLMLLAMMTAAPEVTLVEDGVSKCRIEVSEQASRPEKFGAQEIATYLSKVTGARAEVKVEGEGEGCGLCLVSVSVDGGRSELKRDGFLIDVTEREVSIVGQNPRGALSGCYELLKRSCGIRWLVPGADGEYFTPRKTVSLPVGRIVRNPALPLRIFGGIKSDELYEWCARNGMEPHDQQKQFAGEDERSVRRRNRLEDLAVSGVGRGGHVLSELMLGPGDGKTPAREIAERLYAEHPEFFPLVDGKRKMTWGPYDPNPCVSNPALLDRMAENFIRTSGGPHGSDINVILGNNDTSIWCDCEKCRALDNPAAAGTRGARSDRFWFMVNELARRIWAKRPDIKLGAWAYQDFWYPPTKVKIDPRLRVLISFNNQCWRHAVDDPACTVNGEFRKIFGLWKTTGLEVFNRDEIADEGSPGRYLPSEYVLYRNMLAYPSVGCCGDEFFVYSPFPEHLKWAEKWPPYYGRNLWWRAMWQTAWITAQVMWDLDADFGALYEECNTLYYGKAWEGGMREFRQYLTECFTNTAGCIGYGSGAPVGKCLDFPGSEEKLKALLDKAIASAKAAGDERSLRHLETDREIFGLTWLTDRKRYLESYKENDAFKRKGEIVVDGVLDEADWRNAQVIGGFKHRYETLPPALVNTQTEVRVTYDLDHLYIGVTALEPEMDRIIAGLPSAVNRDSGWKELGNHVELFYQFPDMYEKAFHLAINSEGAIVDGLQKSASDRDIAFATKAKWAVRKGTDRWTLEIAIPCDEIGSKCLPDMVWRLNVGRVRVIRDVPRGETSSCCNGYFYGVPNFIHLKLK